MNFEYSAEANERLLATAQLAAEKIQPTAESLEASDESARDKTMRQAHADLARAGYIGGPIATASGGAGMPMTEWVGHAERVAKACPSVYLSVSATQAAAVVLDRFGGDEQKAAYLAPTLAGEKIGALALSEPNAGADYTQIECVARPSGDGYVLEGTKSFVTNGPIADYLLIAAKTNPEAGVDGLSIFIVDKTASGVEYGPRLSTMGHRGVAIGDVRLVGCKVAKSALVGGAGAGFGYAMHALQFARISVAAGSLGIGEACLDISLQRARTRIAGGQKIIKYQEVSFKLAQMKMLTDTGRLNLLFAAHTVDTGDADAGPNVSVTKIHNSEAATKIASLCVQVFGGEGYVAGTAAERLYRDARLGELLYGTNEIHRVLLAKDAIAKLGG
ncbi:MAG: acyl-CoA dehydrogenase family protein [Deltaproteobacteria bacterium]|nr:acyl-CoA dehydrogenase family protein [Deltaproteobacteria bacterium]